MGYYFNPANKIKKVGRVLKGTAYNALIRQLKEDELLFGLYDRIIFKNAVQLFDEREFDEFEKQELSGNIKREGFFAIEKRTALKYCGSIASQQR